MFVATKKQARDIVCQAATSVNIPYVVDGWLGGMMTKLFYDPKVCQKVKQYWQNLTDANITNITKKRKIDAYSWARNKMERVLGGVANLNRFAGSSFSP